MTGDRLKDLRIYCKLDPDDIDDNQLISYGLQAIAYLQHAGVRKPSGNMLNRTEQYYGLVNALVLDAIDHPGAQVGANLQENRAFRRSLNQMKLTEPVPDLGTGLGVW